MLIATLFILLFLLSLYAFKLKKTLRELNEYLTEILKNNSKKAIAYRRKSAFKAFDKIIELDESLRHLRKTVVEKEKLLEKLFFSIPLPLAFFTRDGTIEFRNYAFEKIFPNKVINDLEDLKNILRKEKFYKLIKDLEQGEDKERKEIELEWEGRFYDVAIEIVSTNEGDSYLIIFWDITEIKKSQQLKEEFAANVSHELKTPITVIKGFIETLEKEIPEDKGFMIKAIKKHTERLENLISDILLLDEIEAGKSMIFKLFNLNDTVKTAIDILIDKANNQGVEIIFQQEDDPINIVGDNFFVLQAIINLLSNAIKFTPSAGKITLKTYRKQNNVCFSCKDTGIGIPPQYIKRIFERFFVIDRSRARKMGGTGLGLSIVKHIVELHKGKIEVVSIPAKGSEFILFFPAPQHPHGNG